MMTERATYRTLLVMEMTRLAEVVPPSWATYWGTIISPNLVVGLIREATSRVLDWNALLTYGTSGATHEYHTYVDTLRDAYALACRYPTQEDRDRNYDIVMRASLLLLLLRYPEASESILSASVDEVESLFYLALEKPQTPWKTLYGLNSAAVDLELIGSMQAGA
jgi:hypothetical protein